MSFKVKEEIFEELSVSLHFKPAPYLARHKWVFLDDTTRVTSRDLKAYIRDSYELIKSKLSKKTMKEMGLGQ